MKAPISRGEVVAIDMLRVIDSWLVVDDFDGGFRTGWLKSVQSIGYRKGQKS